MVKVLDFNYFCRHRVPYILHLLFWYGVFLHITCYTTCFGAYACIYGKKIVTLRAKRLTTLSKMVSNKRRTQHYTLHFIQKNRSQWAIFFVYVGKK